MPPGKRKKRGKPRPEDGKEGTLAGASRAGVEEMLGAKEAAQDDADHHLDRKSVHSDVEWEDLDVQETAPAGFAIDLEAGAKETNGKRKLSKEEMDVQKSLAQVSLLLDLAQGLRLDQATDDPLLQSLMLSTVPAEFMDLDFENAIPWIEKLFQWFSQNFTKLIPQSTDTTERRAPKSLRNMLKNAFAVKEGKGEHLNALFAALLKALGFQTRTVRLLEMQKGKIFVSAKSKKEPKSRRVRHDVWCEVWLDEENNRRWIHVNPLFELIDNPLDVEDSVQSITKVYVVAYYGGGAKDVTPRYISDVARCERLRRDQWWRGAIEPYTEVMKASMIEQASGNEKHRVRDQMEGEDGDLELLIVDRRKLQPKTLNDFKYSLNFILPRHIKRYEGLRPKAKPMGKYRNEPYYLRADLADLHSKTRWIRHGRIVKQSELCKPHKQVKKIFGSGRKPNFTEELSEEDEEEELLGLYGEWQTTQWRPAVAKNGVVPKNEYGKVDIPPLVKSLPKNTTHLTLPRIVPICRELGVDYAIATVGFDLVRGGKLVPKTDGVVVCTEHAQQVIDAYWEREKAQADAEHQERMASGKEGWMKLLKAIHAHLTIQQRYGGDVA